MDEKYILVHHIEGEYEDAECIHDFIAIFPANATDEEIQLSLEKENDKYKPLGKRSNFTERTNYIFTEIFAFRYETEQTIRTFTKVVK